VQVPSLPGPDPFRGLARGRRVEAHGARHGARPPPPSATPGSWPAPPPPSATAQTTQVNVSRPTMPDGMDAARFTLRFDVVDSTGLAESELYVDPQDWDACF